MAESTSRFGFQNCKVGNDGQFGFVELVFGLMGLAVGVLLVLQHVLILVMPECPSIALVMLVPLSYLVTFMVCIGIGLRALSGLKNKVLLPRCGITPISEYDKAKLKRLSNKMFILTYAFLIGGVFVDLKKWDWAIGLVLAIAYVAIYLVTAVWSRRPEMFVLAASGMAFCTWIYGTGGGLEQSMWLAIWLGACSAAAGALRVWRFANNNPLSGPAAGPSVASANPA